MKAIVNVNESWGIGKDGALLVSIPEDMKFFRTVTKNAVVIMGRRTLESFPGHRPLKGRLNIVLSRDPEGVRSAAGGSSIKIEGQKGCELDEAGTRLLVLKSPEEVRALPAKLLQEAFVIGGAEIYREFLPDCSECLVTVNDSRREADTFFPNLNELSAWERVQESGEQAYEGLRYRFTVYRRKAVK